MISGRQKPGKMYIYIYNYIHDAHVEHNFPGLSTSAAMVSL